MTGTHSLVWHLGPASPPRPHHHCSACGTTRPFQPSGKVRLNANGRRLDAWLVYKCVVCDRTWNLPVMHRRPLARIDPADLHAMQHSDPDWVAARTSDLSLLRRHASRIDPACPAQTPAPPLPADDAVEVQITILAQPYTGERLDRCLARALGLSRSQFMALHRAGCIVLAPSAPLNRPPQGQLTVTLRAGWRSRGPQRALSGTANGS